MREGDFTCRGEAHRLRAKWNVRRAGSGLRPLVVIQLPDYVSYGSHERRKLIRRGTHLAQRCRGISRTSHQDIARKSRLRLSALGRVRSACASFMYDATFFCGRHERHTGNGVKVLFDDLLSTRQSVATAHQKIMADRGSRGVEAGCSLTRWRIGGTALPDKDSLGVKWTMLVFTVC
jgi:hypothetical protein